MRCALAFLLSLALFAAWAASGAYTKDYRLRLEHPSGGHGNVIFVCMCCAILAASACGLS